MSNNKIKRYFSFKTRLIFNVITYLDFIPSMSKLVIKSNLNNWKRILMVI